MTSTDAAAPAGDDPIFAATIRPHRSLGPDGFRATMLLCTAVVVFASIRVIEIGFWPVSGFLVLDLLGLFIALQVSYRRGRSFEEVVLTPIELLLRKVTHRGACREWRLNPLWTRLDHETDEEYGLQRLAVVSRGERIDVGRDLSPDEREQFADAFGRALAEVKRGY